MKPLPLLKRFVAIAMIAVLSGCISLQPTPDFARNGDVISFSLGGIKRNVDGQVVTPADLTVTLTDSDSNVHTLKVLGVYRAYPDHTSEYAVRSQDRNDAYYGVLHPHDGALWVSVALLDPQFALLTPLAVGMASLSVQSGKLTQTFEFQDGDYRDLPLEIVAGQNDPLGQSDAQFEAYRSYAYVTIKPDTTPTTDIYGAQIEIEFDSSITPEGPGGEPPAVELRAVPISHNPNMSVIQSVTDNGSTRTLKIFLTNPNGFVSVNEWKQGQCTYDDLVLGITSPYGVLGILATNAVIAAPGTIDLISVNSYYVDENGDPIAGINPILVNEFSGT